MSFDYKMYCFLFRFCLEMFVQSWSTVSDKSVAQNTRVHVSRFGICQCRHSCGSPCFSDCQSWIFQLSAQYLVLHRDRIVASHDLRVVRDAAAVVKPFDNVLECGKIDRRYTSVNLGVSVILFPLSPTPIYFVHFFFELLLIYIAYQLKYRLVRHSNRSEP